jgi:DNA ligase-4
MTSNLNNSIINNNNDSFISKVKFEDFCKLCEKIEIKKSLNDKKDVIKKFINWWKSKTKDNFYPALRLLCPSKDTKRSNDNIDSNDGNEGRTAYGFKIDKLRKQYFNVLGLNRESDDANKLFNYNKGTADQIKDFALVLYEIMKPRSRRIDGTISLEELHQYLDRIANAFEDNRHKDAEEVFERFIRNTTALENKWFVRILLKEMRLGIGDNSILNCFHSDAKEYYETNHSLLKVCTDLSDPEIPLSVLSLSLFSPFSPMLSERVKIKSIDKLLSNKWFMIEVKYDGERFQMHKQLNNYMFFSRNCNDFTQSFSQNLCPFISEAFGDRVMSCILDGEMIGYDISSHRIILKTEKDFDIKRLKDNETTIHPLFIVFDILYLNGEVLTGKPLAERLKILESFIKPVNHRLEFAERKSSQSKEEIIESLNVAIDRREEGIIVKLSDSVYKLNKRQGGGWFKLKPDYIDGLMDELDLLIVGGFYGNRGGISHFLLAVKESEDNNPQKFISVSRVGTGYTSEELKDLQKKLEIHWKKFDKKKAPNFLELGKLNPEVWIEPKNSVVLQVKASEIMQCNGEYRTNYTLRFPRVMKIRDDKEWHQCMSFRELEQMKSQGTLASNSLNSDDYNEQPEKKKRKLMERPTVSSLNRMADVSDVKIERHLFENKEFFVAPFSGVCNEYTKNSLEKLIVENGGKLSAAPLPGKTFCIIANNNNTIIVKKYINSGKYNVVKPDWLLRCINEKRFIDWNPNDMWSQTKQTQNAIQQKFDRFGDSFTEDIYELELKEMFEKMTDLSAIKLLSGLQIADIEFEYWPNNRLEFSLFRILKVFVDNYVTNDQLLVKLVKSQLRFYGSTIVEAIDEKPSYVVCFDKERVDHFRDINRRNAMKFHIVNPQWIDKCVENNKILDIFDINFG